MCRVPGCPQLYAKDSTLVLQLLADRSTPRPGGSQRVLSANHLHRAAPTHREISKNLAYVLSTISSPTFSETVIYYEAYGLCSIQFPDKDRPVLCRNIPAQTIREARHCSRFRIFWAMHELNAITVSNVRRCLGPCRGVRVVIVEGGYRGGKGKRRV